jgi:zinc transport system substrate-binding protein
LVLLTASLVLSIEQADSSVKVAASIFPIASIVEEIGGDKVTVTTIVPAGSDPHHFELTPRAARAIYEADVVFLIGGHFDGWIFGGRIEDKVQPRFFEFSWSFGEESGDSLIPIGDSFNPHFWLDPLFAKAMGGIVNAVLSARDGKNSDFYRNRTVAFNTKIDSLHAATKRRLQGSGFKDFVALHPAWSYFARRYGLNELDTIEISHEQEPSARHIVQVIANMRNSKTEVILAEDFSNPDLAEAVASQTGARIIFLDPMGGSDRPGRDSYFDLIEYNTSLIEQAVQTTHKQ